MRILIVSQYFWPEDFRVNDLVQEMLQRGHDVTVLTGVPNYPSGQVFDDYRRNPSAFNNYLGAPVFRVPVVPRGHGAFRLFLNYLSFVVTASLWGAVKLWRRKFDVIFVFEPSPVTVGLPAVMLSKIKRAPVVFWALDLWPDTLEAIGVLKSPRLLACVGQMVRFIYDNCALVLGQSNGFLKHISQYCSDPKKIRYFPSWAEDIFCQAVEKPAEEVPLRKDLFTVVFAGNIGEAQDMPAVVNAAERLKNDNIRWLIVGDGRKLDWLRDEVDRRGLKEKFMLLGRFPVERMPSFYAHANALLVSLKKDPVFSMTIPGKVQSYLMAGLPVIGMLDGEGSVVIQDARAGLTCAAGDDAALADVVCRLSLMSEEERKRLGNNGRAYATCEYNRTLLMDKLEMMFAEVRTADLV